VSTLLHSFTIFAESGSFAEVHYVICYLTAAADEYELYSVNTSRNSSVGVWAGYGLEDWGSIRSRDKIYLFSIASTAALGITQPPTHWIPITLSLG
jgi:hypothetical protein